MPRLEVLNFIEKPNDSVGNPITFEIIWSDSNGANQTLPIAKNQIIPIQVIPVALPLVLPVKIRHKTDTYDMVTQLIGKSKFHSFNKFVEGDSISVVATEYSGE